ncbi:MAG: hypothetical protein N2748_04300, partial [candidate division WOR-3 bacterium]|nr:hypothetical protein [candidate division WOR-3 bacterium]
MFKKYIKNKYAILIVSLIAVPFVLIAQVPPNFACIPVPYHSQLNQNAPPQGWPAWGEPNNPNRPNNWCTVACLDMIFAFYDRLSGANGNAIPPIPHPFPPLPQTEISQVANTNGATGGPWLGTYETDARRAAHFSSLSTALNSGSNGYSWRNLGYSAIDKNWKDQGWTINDLKMLLANGYPIIVHVCAESLYKYLGSEVKPCTLQSGTYPQEPGPAYGDSWPCTVLGHSLVLIGYNDQLQQVAGIKPNNFVLLDPKAFPLQITQNLFFNNIWDGDFLFTAPWELETWCPRFIATNSKFIVQMSTWYTSPWNTNWYPLDASVATIGIPPGFSLPNNDRVKDLYQWIKDVGDKIPPQFIGIWDPITGKWKIIQLPQRISWVVKAPANTGTFNITVDGKGLLKKCSSTSYPLPTGYKDTIGGKKNITVNVVQLNVNPAFDYKNYPYWCHSSGNGVWYSPAPPQPGQPTEIYAEVHNHGTSPVTGGIVNFYYGDPTLTQRYGSPNWHFIESRTFPPLAPNDSITIGPVQFTPPPANSFGESFFDVFVTVECSQNPITSGRFLEDDNVTCEAYRTTQGTIGVPETLTFWVENPNTLPYYYAIGLDKSQLPTGWTARLNAPLDSEPPIIPPGGSFPLSLIVTPGPLGGTGKVDMIGYLIDTTGVIEQPTGGMTFEVTAPTVPSAWTKREDVPALVKDGGALTDGPETKATTLYCFSGMKTNAFYKFIDGTPATWQTMEQLPFGKKYPDTTKPNTKYIGKGASLCFDGDHKIYATRGNGTFQLWSFDINSGHWAFESYLPSTKGAKGGTSIDFDESSGLLYVLVGGQKLEYENFFAYNPSGKTWATLLKTQPGEYSKAWKDGSCIRKIGNKIYAAKGGDKYNAFWVYDISGNSWDEIESCPQNHPSLGKKNKFGDGTAICTDGSVIYLIKGKGKQDFWMYTPSSKGLWTGLCTIPRYGINYKKSVPKTGASLAYTGSRVCLIKGNKLNEFWQYIPEEKSKIKYEISNISPAIQSNPTPILE